MASTHSSIKLKCSQFKIIPIIESSTYTGEMQADRLARQNIATPREGRPSQMPSDSLSLTKEICLKSLLKSFKTSKSLVFQHYFLK